MQRNQIVDLLLGTISNYFKEQSIEIQPDEQVPLFGAESVLDSMGLVHLIVEIESSLRDNGVDISLISESAMSQRNSPFRTVGTLADFIITQLD